MAIVHDQHTSLTKERLDQLMRLLSEPRRRLLLDLGGRAELGPAQPPGWPFRRWAASWIDLTMKAPEFQLPNRSRSTGWPVISAMRS